MEQFAQGLTRHCKTTRRTLSNRWALSFIAAAVFFGLMNLSPNSSASERYMRRLMVEGQKLMGKGRPFPKYLTGANSLPSKEALLTVHYSFNNRTCDRGCRSENCYRDIVKLAIKRQKKRTIVLVVVASGIYDVVLNWCISVKRLGIENYILVALDKNSYTFFNKRGAPVVSFPVQPRKVSRSCVWIQRTFITYMIVREGINVLVSDADSVMVKSPFLSRRSRFRDVSLDIITTPSNFPNPTTELPEECTKVQGSTKEWRHQPCMGWIFFRSSERMTLFFEQKFLPLIVLLKDDQISFNCAIRKAGALWSEARRWTTATPMTTYLREPTMKLHMLSANHFVRNCTEFSNPAHNFYGLWKFKREEVEMFHCKGAHKIANAKNNGYMFLRDDWLKHSQSLSHNSFASFLSSVSL